MELPKSQNAVQTRGSAPLNKAASRALYIAQDDAGEPGRGSMLPIAKDALSEAAHLSEDDGSWIQGPRALCLVP